MKIEILEIEKESTYYDEALELRSDLISIPFGFLPPSKEKEIGENYFFIGIKEQELLGFGMVTVADDRKSIRARHICVKPNFQKRGIGRLLLEGLEEKAKSLGFIEIFLYAHLESYHFYKKQGYKDVADWQAIENGISTKLMRKRFL